MTGYVSPIPAEERPNYRRRIEGNPAIERLHLWPLSNGQVIPCDSRFCRECFREKCWKEGQVRG